MKHQVSVPEIPKEIALKLCAEIRGESKGRRYTWTAWQCWACEEFARGNPDNLYFTSRQGCRGCPLVNERYSRLLVQTT